MFGKKVVKSGSLGVPDEEHPPAESWATGERPGGGVSGQEMCGVLLPGLSLAVPNPQELEGSQIQ